MGWCGDARRLSTLDPPAFAAQRPGLLGKMHGLSGQTRSARSQCRGREERRPAHARRRAEDPWRGGSPEGVLPALRVQTRCAPTPRPSPSLPHTHTHVSRGFRACSSLLPTMAKAPGGRGLWHLGGDRCGPSFLAVLLMRWHPRGMQHARRTVGRQRCRTRSPTRTVAALRAARHKPPPAPAARTWRELRCLGSAVADLPCPVVVVHPTPEVRKFRCRRRSAHHPSVTI